MFKANTLRLNGTTTRALVLLLVSLSQGVGPMANNFSAFFETLVAGADEYNKAKVGQTALLDAVYKDV